MNTNNSADIVFLNGKVITVDAKDTIAEAVAIKGNLILDVGATTDLEKLVDDSTKVIDLKGKTLLPGFIDSHVHSQDYSIDFSRYCVFEF